MYMVCIMVCTAVKVMVPSRLVWDRVYKSESFGLGYRETDQ